MANLDFDKLNDEVNKISEEKQEREKKIASGEIKEPKKKITEGWTKGPWIVGGIVAAVIVIGLLLFCYVL